MAGLAKPYAAPRYTSGTATKRYTRVSCAKTYDSARDSSRVSGPPTVPGTVDTIQGTPSVVAHDDRHGPGGLCDDQGDVEGEAHDAAGAREEDRRARL